MGGADVITRDCNYIKGGWQRASGTENFEVTDSTTEEIIGTVTAATSGDADFAITFHLSPKPATQGGLRGALCPGN